MKLTILLLLICLMQVSATAYSQATKFNFRTENKQIVNVLKKIEKNSDFRFFYQREQVDVERRVSVKVTDATVENILDELFSGHNIDYQVLEDNLILLTPGKSISTEDVIFQQEKSVTGKVTDESGQQLPGVSVVIKGTTKGTITDENGNYSISVPDDAVLVFSFIGMLSEEVEVGNQITINILMKADAIGLEEVIAIGYGTQKKINLTGAIETVDATKVVQARPISNSLNALQGVMPGVTVTRESGTPGSEGYEIQIRGFSSINGGTPLVLIDGIEGDLNMINPKDIASFTVLKDASAAIYGARAANGVIMITTIRGKKGKPSIRVSSNFGLREMTSFLDKPSLYQVMMMENEARANAGKPQSFSDEDIAKTLAGDEGTFAFWWGPAYIFEYSGKDWVDEALTNGWQHNENISISGGGEKSNYMFSAGNLYQKGNLRYGPDDYNRNNIRMNYDIVVSDRLTIYTKLAYDQDLKKEVQRGASNFFSGLQAEWSGTPIYGETGKPYNFFANPISTATLGGGSELSKTYITTNFKAVYKLTDGLSFTGQYGNNYVTNYLKDNGKKIPSYAYDGSQKGWVANRNYSYEEHKKFNYSNLTGYLNYDKTLADVHSISVMAGASHEEQDYNMFSGKRMDFTNEEVFALNLGDPDQQYSSGDASDWAIRSVFSRIGYAYKGKYLLDANMRYDGSSRFSEETRWGFFPGVMAAWRISEEAFMEELSWLDNMKIRLSIGQAGNQSGIGLYDYIQLIEMGRTYPLGSGTAQSAWLDGMASQSRTWETVETQNIGIDLGLLSSRLDITFDYFIKHNRDMLISTLLPQVLGATPPTTNNGTLKIWGYEINVGWRDRVGDFGYSIRATLSDDQNEITELGGEDAIRMGLVQARQGYPINSYFGYQFEGMIQTQAELDEYIQLSGVNPLLGIGDSRFADLDDDGQIDQNDVIHLGDMSPRYRYGFNLSASWKGLDFNAFIQGVGKRDLMRGGSPPRDQMMYPYFRAWYQPSAYWYEKTWSPERTDAPYPRLIIGQTNDWNWQVAEHRLMDASYLRLKNIQLGYTFNIGEISTARIYVSAEDILTITNMPEGFDPEIGKYASLVYPFNSIYSIGFDINF